VPPEAREPAGAGPLPSSRLPGVHWPAIPDDAGARALALQYQLAESEWWPAEVLARRQQERLSALVRYAAEEVPHYQDSLPRDLLDVDGMLRAERWHQVPILTREAVQRAGMALSGTAMPRDHGAVTALATAGSTGRRLQIACTAVALALRDAFRLRDHLWHERDPSAKLAVIRTFPGDRKLTADEARREGWGAATDAAYPTGPCVLLDIGRDIAAQASWLVRENPEYLLTTPANAVKLAEHCLQHGLRPARLREVCTSGGPLTAAVVAACRAAWSVPVSSTYAAAEAGCIALQCPEQRRYHVQAEGVLVEIVDDDGRSCAPGEVGRVVVTPLHNVATVLLRYDIGDEAAAGAPCACGRGLPVIERIARRAGSVAGC
jgi:phenylacetate-CoA ligase